MTAPDKRKDHWDQVDRLWTAVRRDMSPVILSSAGVISTDASDQAWKRFSRNWAKLCELDLSVATSLYHGVEQMHMAMARRNQPFSPSAQQIANMRELVGLATIARQANPDAETETLGELLALGEQAITADIDRQTG